MISYTFTYFYCTINDFHCMYKCVFENFTESCHTFYVFKRFFNAKAYTCLGSCYGRFIVHADNHSGYAVVKFRNQINYVCNVQK